MGRNKQKYGIFAAVVLVFGVVGSLMVFSTRAAGTASFSLSPSSGSYQVNSTLTVVVNINSSDPVDSVTADFNYNAAHLDYTGASFSGSAFPTGLFETDNGSTVSITRSVTPGNPGVTGTNKFATLNFKVLGSNGATSLTIGPGSGIASAGNDVWNGSPTGGTYTMTAPPASPPPSQGSGGTGGTSQNSGGSSSTPATANTDQPSTEVAQANAGTNTEQSSDNSTEETGYMVAIKVVDKNGKPVANTEVTMGEYKATTDSEGMANFTGVVAGVYTAKALGTEQEINVAAGDPASIQNFAITTQKNNLILYGTIGLIALAVLLVGVGLFLKLRGGSTGGGPAAVEPVLAQNNPATTPQVTPPSALAQPSTVINPSDKIGSH